MDSLSVLLLSVSESDSELLSESLELPEPPLACNTGGARGVATRALKEKRNPVLNQLEKSPVQHKDLWSVTHSQSSAYRPILETGNMRPRRPREWPTVGCFISTRLAGVPAPRIPSH